MFRLIFCEQAQKPHRQSYPHVQRRSDAQGELRKQHNGGALRLKVHPCTDTPLLHIEILQLPPPEVPQPRPDCGIPMTDGTPAACRQKNAAEYLAGRSPGVMTQYGGGLFGAEQHLHSREPAPDEDKSGVLQLVEWREEAPYG